MNKERKTKRKVLVISRDVAIPDCKRGIFYFTTNLVKALCQTGNFETFLLAEDRVDTFSWLNSASDDLISFYRNQLLLTTKGTSRASQPFRFFKLFFVFIARYLIPIPRKSRSLINETKNIDYLPDSLSHLKYFDGFCLLRNVYFARQYRFASAIPFIVPIIDAREFDIVVIDSHFCVKIVGNKKTKIIGIIHDLLPLTDIGLPQRVAGVFKREFDSLLKTCSSYISVTQHTRDRVLQFFNTNTHILYPRSDFYSNLISIKRDPSFSEFFKYSTLLQTSGDGLRNKPFFVTIMSAEVRKNIQFLIDAFSEIDTCNLLIIGNHTTPTLKIPNSAKNIAFTGWVSDVEKWTLICNSAGLIAPSLAEGFGIPLIEAFAAAVPLVCSDIPVFREVAEDNAIYFVPFSIPSLLGAIKIALKDRKKIQDDFIAKRDYFERKFGLSTLVDDFIKTIEVV